MSIPTLNKIERIKIKKFLIDEGVRISALNTDEALLEAAIERGYIPSTPAPTAPTEPTQEPKPEPAPEPKPEPKPEPAPAEPAEPAPEPNLEGLTAALAALLSSTGGQGGVSEERVNDLIEAAQLPRVVEVRNPATSSVVQFDRVHPSFDRVLKKVQAGLNVYLVGPAGSGKTHLAEQVAKALDLPFHFTGAVGQKHELLGFLSANNEYRSTPFYDWATKGGVFLFDEMDGSHSSALIAFNAALSNKIAVFPNGETVRLHESCVAIGAGNTVGTGANRQYTGRQALDKATLDRFVFEEMDYDLALEQELTTTKYQSLGGEDLDLVKDMLATIRTLRNKAIEQGLACVISPRASVQAASMLASGLSFDESLQAAVVEKLSKTERQALKVGV